MAGGESAPQGSRPGGRLARLRARDRGSREPDVQVTDDGTGQSPPSAMLDIRDLRIHFPTDDGLVKAVDGVSFALDRGRTLGIVGESGSGKSVTSLGILGLYNTGNAMMSGKIYLDGEDLVAADQARVRELRGLKMAMIFQDPDRKSVV